MAGEKRSKDQEDSLLKENVIIVDIEGTTTSISFVKDTLFPYVRENVRKYIDAKWDDEEFKRDLEKLKEQAKKDEEDKTEGLIPISGTTIDEEKESLVKNILWQMDGDRKTGALKQLQGHMWREAFDSGSIKGHVFDDVPECLKSWTSAGKKVYVYSSGSVEAQKLLFGHSKHGDLLEYFSGYFDTEVGMKQEAASYKNILNKIKAEANDVVFLTDIVKEAKAAKETGMTSIIMIREGNAALSEEDREGFRTANSFLDLLFLNSAKRQKLDTSLEVPKKEELPTEPVVEKMEISEDVEMTDVSDKDSKSKVESNDKKLEAEETSENKIGTESTSPTTLETVIEKDEAMEVDGKSESVKKIEDNIKNTKEPEEETKAVDVVKNEKENDSEKEETKENKTKSEEIVKTVEKEFKAGDKPGEIIEKSNTDETDKAVVSTDNNKKEILEKPVEIEKKEEKKVQATKTEISDKLDEAMEEGKEEECGAAIASKADNISDAKVSEKEEDKENTTTKITTEIKKTEEECEKKSKTDEKETEKNEKTVETEAKEDSEKLIAAAKPIEKEEEAVTIKSDEISVKKEDTVKENGTSKTTETVDETATEKKAAEGELKKNNEDGGLDAKKTELAKVEETLNKSESKESSVEKNSTGETKAVATAASETLADGKKETKIETKDSTDLSKSVGDKGNLEKEVASNNDNNKITTTDEVKKDSVGEEPAKKVNGTTQNGSSVEKSDENTKIHTNGVNNEPCTSDESNDKKTSTNTTTTKTTITTDALPQNREPESSTDSSNTAESIKLKKVVENSTTVTVAADGAGEPDVPPAVVVAATS